MAVRPMARPAATRENTTVEPPCRRTDGARLPRADNPVTGKRTRPLKKGRSGARKPEYHHRGGKVAVGGHPPRDCQREGIPPVHGWVEVNRGHTAGCNHVDRPSNETCLQHVLAGRCSDTDHPIGPFLPAGQLTPGGLKGRGVAWRLRRGSRERRSLVITKGAKRLSNDHVIRRPVNPAAHSTNPDVRGAVRRELGRATLSR